LTPFPSLPIYNFSFSYLLLSPFPLFPWAPHLPFPQVGKHAYVSITVLSLPPFSLCLMKVSIGRFCIFYVLPHPTVFLACPPFSLSHFQVSCWPAHLYEGFISYLPLSFCPFPAIPVFPILFFFFSHFCQNPFPFVIKRESVFSYRFVLLALNSSFSKMRVNFFSLIFLCLFCSFILIPRLSPPYSLAERVFRSGRKERWRLQDFALFPRNFFPPPVFYSPCAYFSLICEVKTAPPAHPPSKTRCTPVSGGYLVLFYRGPSSLGYILYPTFVVQGYPSSPIIHLVPTTTFATFSLFCKESCWYLDEIFLGPDIPVQWSTSLYWSVVSTSQIRTFLLFWPGLW